MCGMLQNVQSTARTRKCYSQQELNLVRRKEEISHSHADMLADNWGLGFNLTSYLLAIICTKQ